MSVNVAGPVLIFLRDPHPNFAYLEVTAGARGPGHVVAGRPETIDDGTGHGDEREAQAHDVEREADGIVGVMRGPVDTGGVEGGAQGGFGVLDGGHGDDHVGEVRTVHGKVNWKSNSRTVR